MMINKNALKNNATKIAEVAIAAVGLVALAAVGAHAGTDTTFSTTTTQLTSWASGSLGKMAAVAGIATALIGMVLKFDWKLIGGAVGIGLAAATGPGIVGALATATF